MNWITDVDWAGVLIQGTLVGGLYALFAIGLSLAFGIMRLVNIAHGDLIVLSAYAALLVVNGMGVNPFVSLLVVVPLHDLGKVAIPEAILQKDGALTAAERAIVLSYLRRFATRRRQAGR